MLKDNAGNHRLSFSEYTEKLDNTLSRALKVQANVNNLNIEKTRAEWDSLLQKLQSKPLS